MGKYANRNAESVLAQVERCLEEIDSQPRRRYRIGEVCERLSIFVWWPEHLGEPKLKDMRRFLRAAIERGYHGYVCFKVGATGCANGMWAYKKESEDGHSPDGGFLYKSFTPDCNYWAAKTDDGEMFPSGNDFDCCKTVKQLEALMSEQSA